MLRAPYLWEFYLFIYFWVLGFFGGEGGVLKVKSNFPEIVGRGGREGGRSEGGGGGIRVRENRDVVVVLEGGEEEEEEAAEEEEEEEEEEGSLDGWGKVAINCYKSGNKQ
jgi:hypothetical protein